MPWRHRRQAICIMGPRLKVGLRGFRMIPTYMHTCARGERPFVSEPHLAVASLSIGERAFEVNDLGARSL